MTTWFPSCCKSPFWVANDVKPNHSINRFQLVLTDCLKKLKLVKKATYHCWHCYLWHLKSSANLLFIQQLVEGSDTNFDITCFCDSCMGSGHCITTTIWRCRKNFSQRQRSFTPWNEVPFWRLFIFYLLVKSKSRLVGRIYVFLCIVCTILLNLYFGKCWWHLLILEKLVAWAYIDVIGWKLR